MPTDMDRLIEDVARALILADDAGNPDAILASTEHGGDCTEHPWTCPLCEAEEYRTLARAAIRATLRGIREPNFQMRRAADERDGTGDPHADIYRAMIDRLIQDFAPEGKDA